MTTSKDVKKYNSQCMLCGGLFEISWNFQSHIYRISFHTSQNTTLSGNLAGSNRPGAIPFLQTSAGGKHKDPGKQNLVVSKSINSKESIPET